MGDSAATDPRAGRYVSGEGERALQLLITPPASSHSVQFYDDAEVLGGAVAQFLASGFTLGEPALVVATPHHRRIFTDSLAEAGVDGESTGLLYWLDARETVSRITRDDAPDASLFASVVGDAIETTRIRRPGARVRIFGEMVDLLWGDGKAREAIVLEEMWNELGKKQPFSLLCAYMLGHFDREVEGATFRDVCHVHSHVLPTEGYSNVDRDAALREIASLQQRARTLESEIENRKKFEVALRGALRERARVADALRRSNRDLDQFAYVASHDLKSPLRAIANLSQWIEDDHRDTLSPEAISKLELLRSRVGRMEAIIDGILKYSRAGSTREVEEVNVGVLVSEVLDAYPNVAVHITVASDMPTFDAERIPLYQVFQNLIGNAIKYTRKPGAEVIVRVEDAGAFFHFSVADNGAGIAEDQHERIWKTFARATDNGAETVEGTGIGLSVVRKITEMRGGRSWLESTVGKGSTFHFTWPKTLSADHGSRVPPEP